MHLSNELQQELTALHSKVALTRTIAGILPAEYAFLHGTEKTFSVRFAHNSSTFSVTLSGLDTRLELKLCQGRALVTGMKRVALLIHTWIDKQQEVAKLAQRFTEVEVFEPFPAMKSTQGLAVKWLALKNHLFNNDSFWREKEWERQYVALLDAARNHPYFADLYPFFSHYELRFSMDEQITKGWSLSCTITVCNGGGKEMYCVSGGENRRQYFGHVQEALDYYAEVLKTTSVRSFG